MRSIIFLAMTLGLLLAATTAGAVTKGAQLAANLDTTPIHWYEDGVEKTAWMALDELAVLSGSQAADSGAVAKSLDRDAQVAETTTSYTIVRSSGTIARDNLVASAEKATGPVSPVFYRSPDAQDTSRIVLSGQIIVGFDEGTSGTAVQQIENDFSLERVKSFDFAPNAYLYKVATPWKSLDTANSLAATNGVKFAYPSWIKAATKRQSSINDPLFASQWHLQNTGQNGGTSGQDINVVSTWSTYLGTHSQVIGIVDPGGMEIAHEDLKDNVIASLDWSFVKNSGDPTNASIGDSGDSHGTSCAGLAAARDNSLGVRGVAPEAGLAGIEIGETIQDQTTAQALVWKNTASSLGDSISIYNNSWGPADDAHLEAPGPLVISAFQSGLANGRNNKGSIYVWAGGNGGYTSTAHPNLDNSNYDGYANSRYVIPVAASDFNGVRSYYSEKGANILLNAPSSGSSLSSGIWTTDHTGSNGYNPGNSANPDAGEQSTNTTYTSTFGGTSATAPEVAGAVALMLQANANLTWRDVQQILMLTADKNDPNDSDWSMNGAGHWVNHKYGFGRLNVQNAVTRAQTWTSVGAESFTFAGSEPNTAIPDNNTTGVSDTITVSDNVTIDFVEVVFSSLNHTYWGDLQITLTSPSGTVSVLSEPHTVASLTGYNRWRFGTRRHFGESSQGQWKLTVKDLVSGDTGTFNYWDLKFYGTPVSIAAPSASFSSDVNSAANGRSTKDNVISASGPLTVNFSDTSKGQISAWNWDFGDGSTSTSQNPTHTYANSGNYTVSLGVTGTTNAGAQSTNTATRASFINFNNTAGTSSNSGGSSSSGSSGSSGGGGGGSGGGCTLAGASVFPDWLLAGLAGLAAVGRRLLPRKRT